MPGRRDDFDHQQVRGGLGLRQDVADVARVAAFAALEALHRSRLDQPRRRAAPQPGALATPISAAVCATMRAVSPGGR